MIIRKASFQTRARAVDHLGRGQIADAPTAISELWKNAYDAYARDVQLHIFDGPFSSACIFDNGHGMTTENLLEKWLVIGTDSKIGSSKPNPIDMFGLKERARQGEKGIGRLSAAFLGPITLVVSKKKDSPYSVLLVDWRFFENPFLFIDDVIFPLQEVNTITDIPKILGVLSEEIRSAIANASERVQDAWEKFDQIERKNGDSLTTRERILNFDPSEIITSKQLVSWRDILKKLPPEEGEHGTALFCLDAAPELSNWLEGDLQTAEQKEVRSTLYDTLVSFIDPLLRESLSFEYGIYVHTQNKPVFPVLESGDIFTVDDFLDLEHWAIGECDEKGVFRGKVKAFGEDFGEVVITPADYIPEMHHRSRLGPFQLRLGSFEQEQRSSSLPAEQFARFDNLQKKYAGISMYRDGLRVLPYGREGADLFEVEKRRTLNAGRYFYSYRRTFGGVSFSSKENPNLKDKAGREGLVDNKARRALVRLVKNIMVELADRYFGRSSPNRERYLDKAQKQYADRKKAADKLRKRTKQNFQKFLKEATPKAIFGVSEARSCTSRLEEASKDLDLELLFEIRVSVDKLDALRDDLKLPIQPFEDEQFEEKYRTYRDAYADFCIELENLKIRISELESEGYFGPRKEVIMTHFHSNQSKLSALLSQLRNGITIKANHILDRWTEIASEDFKKYHAEMSEFILNIDEAGEMQLALNHLDRVYLKLRDEFEIKYQPVISALEQIEEAIDIEGAWMYTERENIHLQEKVNMLHTTAQLGITVEIVGHELESLEAQMDMQMRRFPREVKELNAYKLAIEAQKSLTDRLRFLMPLKKGAYRNRTIISGNQITNYLSNFFGNAFEAVRCDFVITDDFKNFTINDLPSRIYPTFINMVNNSLYWVQFTKEELRRQICLHRVNNLVIISDTGPGVDPDDRERIFELFFTRRSSGRGIGLYLCRQNLAMAGHKIRYAQEDDPKGLGGANFIIEFKEVHGDS